MSEKRRKKKMNRWKLVRIILTTVVVLTLITLGILILKKKVGEKYGTTSQSEILSATVEKNSISTTVSGSGQLSDDDVEEIEVPENIEIDEYVVSVGDTVEAGDVLAKVNTNSVITAMAGLQSDIDALDAKLEEASGAEIDSTIKATVSGRVKKIFAETEDKVISVMYENNALMVISADGNMAVDLEGSSVKEGEEVTVVTSEGTEISGKVKYVSGSTATVLFSDDGPAIGDKVTVKASDGTVSGSGECYVNSPVTVVGYGGTIENVMVSENSAVKEGDSLFALTDTEDTIDFETILKERKQLEETLAELMEIYRNGAICATIRGSVRSVPTDDESSSKTGSGSSSGTKSGSGSNSSESEKNTFFSISPDLSMTVSVKVDESDILSLQVGQEVKVTVESVSQDAISGTITHINKSGTSNDGVTSYTADVQIEKQEGMLEGMSAKASIAVESVDDALVIPVAALNETSSSAYVYTSYDEETGELGGMVEVTVGIENSSYVEIREGLAEGATVYYKEKTSNRNNRNNFNMGSGRPGSGSGDGGFGNFGNFGVGSGGNGGNGGSFTPPSGMPGGGMPSFPGGDN